MWNLIGRLFSKSYTIYSQSVNKGYSLFCAKFIISDGEDQEHSSLSVKDTEQQKYIVKKEMFEKLFFPWQIQLNLLILQDCSSENVKSAAFQCRIYAWKERQKKQRGERLNSIKQC